MSPRMRRTPEDIQRQAELADLVDRAAKVVGSQRELARLLGCSESCVHRYRETVASVPARVVAQCRELVGDQS